MSLLRLLKKHPWLVVLVVAAVALPFFLESLFDRKPSRLRFGAGAKGSRFWALASALGEKIEARTGVAVELVATQGAIDNLKKLAPARPTLPSVDIAIYQPSLAKQDVDESAVGFVSNLYPQPVHLIVRSDRVSGLDGLANKTINVGPRDSADNELGRAILGHLKVEAKLEERPFREAAALLAGEKLDAALVSMGISSAMFADLAAAGGETDWSKLAFLPISETAGLCRRFLVLNEFTLPAGLYAARPIPVPRSAVRTVAVEAQLLARADLDAGLVEEITRIVHSRDFLLENQLLELYADAGYASSKPSFTLHAGAANFYDPELKPVLNPDFVEALEGLRSFIVSIVIALFVAVQWIRARRKNKHGAVLNEHIERLLAIEKEQLYLDQTHGSADLEDLQQYLDEVTSRRREALEAFKLEDMVGEPRVEIFLTLTNSLSQKISEKISRQRMDRGLDEVKALLAESGPSGPSS